MSGHITVIRLYDDKCMFLLVWRVVRVVFERTEIIAENVSNPVAPSQRWEI
jgi:hypothetical protein